MDDSGIQWDTKFELSEENPQNEACVVSQSTNDRSNWWQGGDWMFTSQYNHTIDTKGRVIVPSKFRELLGNEFVITKGMDGCLFGFSQNDWTVFEQKLTSLPITNKNARKFARFFLAGAATVEIDGHGRVLIPSNLREFADLEKDIVMVGVGSRLEVWSKDRWIAEDEDEDMNAIGESMENLGITI